MSDRIAGRRRGPSGLVFALVLLFLLLVGSRYIASTLIDYAWWNEMHQVDTWVSLLLYGTGPLVVASVVFFLAFWTALRLGLPGQRNARLFGFFDRGLFLKIALFVLAVFSIGVANATVDNWTVVRFFGGLRLPSSRGEFIDPIFGKPLHFYFFELPFFNMLLNAVLAGLILALAIYWLAAHAERLSRQLPVAFPVGGRPFDLEQLDFRAAFDSNFVRVSAAILLLGIALKMYFGRYGLLLEDHGQYLVGVDWVADHVVLPLQWLLIAGALAAAGLVLTRRGRWALVLLLLIPARYVLPSILTGLYVHPNELALERPYIQHHIAASRSAYGLDRRVTETHLEAVPEIPLDYAAHKPLLDNVRLWDWRAFHDTISQIQPLRPYVYIDTDIDRYQIDGQLRQVMIAPRELDIRQLGEARTRWINPHLIYTHGYGIVMAEANRITQDGLPLLFVKNAPPVVTTKALQFTRPEIYYSEVAHEPVFVDTGQQEFNYPSGSDTIKTTYEGKGGFPIASLGMRLAAALEYGDANILLTEYLTANSRMMIHRAVRERLNKLAGFVSWDSDPYLVLNAEGRLVWIADGYMSSDAHPYSREIDLSDRTVNYLRNSLKATIDAYTGETKLYVFDPDDVLIQAYGRLFPNLFLPRASLPKDLQAHTRYPETLFSVQAEMYRTFHMRDPETFYNRADLWDLAKTSNKAEGSNSVSPTYVVATLPNSNIPEFLLMTTFTPANKDNLIGVMYARCDGEHLGELVFEQLSKQNIIYGPMQIDARVNQDQNISKDLSLWSQYGSQVLRGQTLVLPIADSFLYVEPIYIQSSQTSMPQLKRVALAMGNRLSYADTYEKSLAQLIEQLGATDAPAPASPPAGPQPQPSSAVTSVTPPAPPPQALETLQQVRQHLQRYRELGSQGKWAEAGKELDEIQRLTQK
jgi:uncharacterized membrane protein (UPF0182 family)